MAGETHSYVLEYNDVISQISSVCSIVSKQTMVSKPPSVDVEAEVLEVSPRIQSLAATHKSQPEEVRERCFLETLLKGSFSLLAVRSPHAAFRVSACNLGIFFEIMETIVQSKQHSVDFKKVFNFMFETVRGLLIYAKEGKFDTMFVDYGLVS